MWPSDWILGSRHSVSSDPFSLYRRSSLKEVFFLHSHTRETGAYNRGTTSYRKPKLHFVIGYVPRPWNKETTPPKLTNAELFICANKLWPKRESKKCAILLSLGHLGDDMGWYILDYVFVDEHNRHKRLKGMRYPQSMRISLLIQRSDASLWGVPKKKN